MKNNTGFDIYSLITAGEVFLVAILIYIIFQLFKFRKKEKEEFKDWL